MSDIRAELQDVFRSVFDDEEIVLKDEMTAADISEWDSLHHISLIISVEGVFGIRLGTAEIAQLKQPGQNIGTFIQMLEKKVKAK